MVGYYESHLIQTLGGGNLLMIDCAPYILFRDRSSIYWSGAGYRWYDGRVYLRPSFLSSMVGY
jgi:hypothetical protein